MKVQTALVFAASVTAAPSEKASHELQYVKRGDVQYPYYYNENISFNVHSPSDSDSLVPTSDEETVSIGKQHLLETLDLSADDLEITRYYKSSDGVMHIYAVHKINNLAVINHDAAVHVLNGQIIAESASFTNAGDSLDSIDVNEPIAKITLEDAVEIATKQYGISKDDFPASNAYVELPGNKIVYVHQFQLRDDVKEKWIQVSVDASNGQIVQVIDYLNHATFKAIQLPHITPLDGFSSIADPENEKASPRGWSQSGSSIGNNVDSRIGNLRANIDNQKGFETNWKSSEEPTSDSNKNAAIVNNFYVSNMMHDISYQYGFDEAAGNFQDDNYGRGGRGGDRVIINNQANGSNNANFATPPDGQIPTMNMYLWTFNTPRRDGSLDNSVPIHEYGHGISNRLTGGPAASGCLSNSESGGMGEGWSDAFAFILTQDSTKTRQDDYALGAYVYNNPKGIRSYKYSTSMSINPYTFNSVNSLSGVHSIGTVWATMLYELYWNLIDAYGFSSNLMDTSEDKGNTRMMQLLLGGMKVQPCNPTFTNARDAIISADRTYYGGSNRCLIWQSFAKRGLGVDAVQNGRKNGFKVPDDCSKPTPTTTTVVITSTPAPSSTFTETSTTTTSTGPIPTSTPCPHDKCVTGGTLPSSCDACVAKINSGNFWCRFIGWNKDCVSKVETVCGIKC
jgi:extracellular elastinolytic metalloproteinase